MSAPPGPPCRKTNGLGAGWERGLLKMATARRMVRPWGAERSSGTTTKPQRTSLPATIPAPSLKWQAVGSKRGGAGWVLAAGRNAPVPEPTSMATATIALIQPMVSLSFTLRVYRFPHRRAAIPPLYVHRARSINVIRDTLDDGTRS